jgi:hypothetical protein
MSKIEDGAFIANPNLHWVDLSECDSLKSTDISKYGVCANALVYVPESFGDQTADNVVYGSEGALQCAKYNLTGSHDYDVPKAFTAKAVTFDRKFAKDSKYALTLPFAAGVPAGFKAYILSSDDGTKMTFKRVESIEANTPYVVCKDTDGATFSVYGETTVTEPTARTTQTKSDNYAMTGTLAAVGNAYAVGMQAMAMNSEGMWNLLTTESGTGIEPFAAYVQTSTASAATANVASELIDYEKVTLDENKNNTGVISENNGDYVVAAIVRTLKAGTWNTLSLPFNTKIKGSPLEGAAVMGVKEINGNVISFVQVDSLKAGEAYIVKPADKDITNPTFVGVKMDKTQHSFTGDYEFVPNYSPMTVDAPNTVYCLEDGNLKLASVGSKVNGLSGYFVVRSSDSVQPKLDIDSETIDAIDNIEADEEDDAHAAVYSVDGVYMGSSLEALPRGVYIVNGKKVVK